MRKKSIYLVAFLFSIAWIVFAGCTGKDEKEKCEEEGGIWHREVCVKEDISEDESRQAGLLKKEKTEFYEIEIVYPHQVLKYPKIQERLDKIVKNIESETGIRNIGKENSTASFPWQLYIDADNFRRAGDLASILVYVMSYTGGAHPNHYYESINFNTQTQSLIGLEELFNDPEYIYRISEYVTSKLLEKKSKKTGEEVKTDEWIERGALPLGSNFEIFVFIPDEGNNKIKGIKFIFPPYTVGPYSDGKYEVTVPSEVFYKYLNDRHRGSFDEPGN